jgi:hypothetical protein
MTCPRWASAACRPRQVLIDRPDEPEPAGELSADEVRAALDEDRTWLRQAVHTASQDFDKAIMTLSGGALGLSITFVHDIAPHPDHKWALGIAWTAFTVSLVLILISHLTSQEASRGMMAEIDAGRNPREKFDLPGWATTGLNVFAAGSLIGGVAFLVLFALYNL